VNHVTFNESYITLSIFNLLTFGPYSEKLKKLSVVKLIVAMTNVAISAPLAGCIIKMV
jgi:hypothetical protein